MLLRENVHPSFIHSSFFPRFFRDELAREEGEKKRATHSLRYRGGEGEWIATNDKTRGRDETKREAGEGVADSDPSSRIPDSGCFFIIAIDWNVSPGRTCRAALRRVGGAKSRFVRAAHNQRPFFLNQGWDTARSRASRIVLEPRTFPKAPRGIR